MAIGPYLQYTPPSDPLPIYIQTSGHVVNEWESWDQKSFRANYVEINKELTLIDLEDSTFGTCLKCGHNIVQIKNFDGYFSWGYFPTSIKISCDEAMVQKILTE